MRTGVKAWIYSGIVLIVLILGLVYFISTRNSSHNQALNSASSTQNQVSIDGNVINVEIEDTDVGREEGLSDRPVLGANDGMLFVFNQAERYGFWMKDMEFPLDMIWIDGSDTIVDITPKISPETYPKVFYPQSPAEYVLEVNSGYASVHNIKIGDKIIINKNA